jgi:hypothetical protein
MTPAEFLPLVEQYRAGLDAEMMLLHRLQAIAVEQRRASELGAVREMQDAVDHRDRVMATLVTVERDLAGIRRRLLEAKDRLADLPAFQDVVALHRQAADLVADIVTVDQDSLSALHPAEEAPHVAAQPLEQGESALAASGRVVTPTCEHAALVNRKE